MVAPPLLGFLVFLLYPLLLRAAHVSGMIVTSRSGESSPFIAAASNDLVIIAALLAVAGLAMLSRNSRVRILAFVFVAAIHFLMLLDLIIFREFSQRLTLPDFQRYASYTLVYLLSFPLEHIIGGATLAAVYVLSTVWAYRFIVRQGESGRAAVHLFSLGFLALLGFAERPRVSFVHAQTLYSNFVEYNRANWSARRPYSSGFVNSVDPTVVREICEPTRSTTGPVILYMVESLSSYHSALFGGLHDWTPHLDSIGQSHTAFINFLSSGFTTEDAEIALLTGLPPILPPNTLSVGGGVYFRGYWGLRETLPNAMRDAGYETAFLTTADLEFSATGEWAHSVGFDFVEGSESPAYDGHRRYHFDAAADEILVQRVLDYMREATARTFVFVKTVSGHHPFVDPVTGDLSEEGSVRYVDAQIQSLVHGLERIGFFETGHLIIVGDHRAMTPLHEFELDTWGPETALARVPAVVVSETFMPRMGLVLDQFNQVDLSGSLMAGLAGKKCVSQFKQIIGDQKDAPVFRIHRRGDLRNALSVFSDGRYGSVLLNGDQTRFTDSDFSAEEEDRILEYVNYRRIEADQNVRYVAGEVE